MNRLYNSMEPRVMDDNMLKLAVGEQGPRQEAGQLAKQEGILFKDVLSLQLDFKSAYPGLRWGHQAALCLCFLDPRIPRTVHGLEPTSALGPAWARRHRIT